MRTLAAWQAFSLSGPVPFSFLSKAGRFSRLPFHYCAEIGYFAQLNIPDYGKHK